MDLVDKNIRDLNFGLVGCGRIGLTGDERIRHWPMSNLWTPYSHAKAIDCCQGARLSAVCDMNSELAEVAASKYDLNKYYTDFSGMIDAENLDVISIATRTQARSKVLHHLFHRNRGKINSVYCEKPLSTSLEESDEIIDYAIANEIKFYYATNRRYMPVFVEMREKLESNLIGSVRNIVVRFGPGALLWSLPHAVDAAIFFASDAPVEAVSARLKFDKDSIKGNVFDCDPILETARITFGNGVTAYILSDYGMDVQVGGELGNAYILRDGENVLVRRFSGGDDLGWLNNESHYKTVQTRSGTLCAISSIVEEYFDDSYNKNRTEQIRKNQEVLFAMLYSQLGCGEEIKFPLERRGYIVTGRNGSLFA